MPSRKPKRGTQAYARAHGQRRVVSLRLSPAAVEALDAASKAEGITRGEWVEAALLGPGAGLPPVVGAALATVGAVRGVEPRALLRELVLRELKGTRVT